VRSAAGYRSGLRSTRKREFSQRQKRSRGLYAPDAILLGTTSPLISKGTEGIRRYFQELPGSGRKNTIVERRTIVLSDTAVVGTGFYNFARVAENNTPRPSRFTMVVVKRDGRWMIAHHIRRRCRPHANELNLSGQA